MPGLSDAEINEIMFAQVPNYKGTMAINELPKKISPDESGIVNYQIRAQGGTHWVAYYNTPKLNYVLYFDSFGISPPSQIVKFLKTSKKEILYSTTSIQDPLSSLCGYYCMMFILEMEKGISFVKFLNKFNSLYPKKNESILKKYFSS